MRNVNKSGKTPRAKFIFARRGPYLLVAIIALLVYVGIEITEGLGWLTAQEWLDDFVSLLGVFALVIAVSVVVTVIVFTLLRLFKKPEPPINWNDFGGDENEKDKR